MITGKKPIKKAEVVVPVPITPEDQAVIDRLKAFGKRFKSAAWQSNKKR